MYRNSLGLPVAAILAAVLGCFTLALNLGWVRVTHAPAAGTAVIDGKIGPGEYAHQYSANDIGMSIYWTIAGDEIRLAGSAPGKGWIAVGWGGDGPLMLGYDIAIGYVDSTGAHFGDNYADEPVGHQADTELGGTADIVEASGTESASGTVFEWRRKLVTGDAQFDKPFHPGVMPVIMAYSDAQDFVTYHDAHRATAQIDFLGAAATERHLIPEHLTEYQIGLLAWVLVLAVYGVVGLASVWLEGTEPVPGRHQPQAGAGAAVMLAVCAGAALAGMAAFVWQVALGTGPVLQLGLTGTFWMWSLALVFAVYRRYFVPDEVIEQDRDEEVPW